MDELSKLAPTGFDDPVIIGFVLGVAAALYCVRAVRTGSLSLRPPPPKDEDSADEIPTKRDPRR